MNNAANPCEIDTIKAFLTSNKRDRYVAFVANQKRRKDFVRDLAHFDNFDARYIVRIATADQTPAGIEALLLAKGAAGSCHLMSEWSSLDGREMNLSEALREVIGRGMGTILCCKSGQLAYFENEDQRFILEHPSNKGNA
jgi:hypothetical protein